MRIWCLLAAIDGDRWLTEYHQARLHNDHRRCLMMIADQHTNQNQRWWWWHEWLMDQLPDIHRWWSVEHDHQWRLATVEIIPDQMLVICQILWSLSERRSISYDIDRQQLCLELHADIRSYLYVGIAKR